MTRPLPSRLAFVLLCLAVHTLGLVSGLLYMLVLVEAAGVDMVGYPSARLALAHAAGVLAVAVWAAWISGPLARLGEALASGRAAEDLDGAEVRQAVTLHRRASVWMLGTYLIGAPLLTATAEAGGWRVEPLASHMRAMSVLEGIILSVVMRFALKAWLARRVTPVLLAHGEVQRVPHLRLSTVGNDIALLLLLLAGLLPLSGFLLLRSGYGTVPAFAVLYAHFLWTSGLVGGLVYNAVSRPLHELEAKMAQVSGGELHLQAPIRAPDTLGAMSSHFNAMVQSLERQSRLRELFGRYVTPEVAERILAGQVALGGERRVATVLFADIQGFTSLAENMPPEQALDLLNRILGAMAEEVIAAGGTLDKFLGDALMALFGVPLSQGSPEADARAAVACALAMSEALDRVNDARRAEGLHPVELGIGVATGELVAGNVGTEKRMDYTAIGDTVNLASRLQGLTRRLGRRIVLDERTAAALGAAPDPDEVFSVRVRGRREKVRVVVLGPTWSPGLRGLPEDPTITMITEP